jgi:Cu-processing system permease protein
MNTSAIVVLAKREVRDALRNRWFLAYAGAYVALSVGLSLLVLISADYGEISGFGRTAAGLINLVLFLAPLMGLTLGAQALAGERERGTFSYLLAQPVSPGEIFMGKFLGLALAVAVAVISGFGLSTLMVSLVGSSEGADSYAGLTILTVLLAWGSLSIGYLISSRSRRTSSAIGVAVVVWLLLTLVGDLGLMGTAVVLKLRPAVVLAVTILNPLESYRIAAISLLRGSFDLLGPAGLAARYSLGDWTMLVLAAVLVIWLVAPLPVAYRAMVREDRR